MQLLLTIDVANTNRDARCINRSSSFGGNDSVCKRLFYGRGITHCDAILYSSSSLSLDYRIYLWSRGGATTRSTSATAPACHHHPCPGWENHERQMQVLVVGVRGVVGHAHQRPSLWSGFIQSTKWLLSISDKIKIRNCVVIVFSSFCSSPNRDHPVQGVRRQVEWGPLWRHHLWRLQRLLSTLTELRSGELPMSPSKELCRGSGQPESMPIMPASKVLGLRHVSRR